MTSSLRRKRPTTAVPSTPARMAVSLIAAGLWLAGSAALAQDSPRSTPLVSSDSNSQPAKVLHFRKAPGEVSIDPTTASFPGARTAPAKAAQPAPAPERWSSATPFAANPARTSGSASMGLNPARPANQAAATVRPAAFQTQYPPPGRRGAPEEMEPIIQLQPPGPQRIFQLDSEARLHERWRQLGRDEAQPEPIQFPEEPVVGEGPYLGRQFAQRDMLVEPSYVCHHRLFFEDKNSERYGWDLGFVQPFLSAGVFYWDLALLPYHFWTNPCQHYECSAGYCLPGDPVPYLIYPPQISFTGFAAEAATIVGLLAVFP